MSRKWIYLVSENALATRVKSSIIKVKCDMEAIPLTRLHKKDGKLNVHWIPDLFKIKSIVDISTIESEKEVFDFYRGYSQNSGLPWEQGDELILQHFGVNEDE